MLDYVHFEFLWIVVFEFLKLGAVRGSYCYEVLVKDLFTLTVLPSFLVDTRNPIVLLKIL